MSGKVVSHGGEVVAQRDEVVAWGAWGGEVVAQRDEIPSHRRGSLAVRALPS